MPDTVPPASPIRAVTSSTVSWATSSLVTTSSTLLAGEGAVDQGGRDGLLEGVGGVQLGLQLLGAVLQRALVLLEGGDLVLDVGEDRLVQRGGADDDPQRDGQEDGDQRDQVIAEVDHEKRFSNQNTKLFHWSSRRSRYTCPTADTASADPMAMKAASTSTTSAAVEMRLR